MAKLLRNLLVLASLLVPLTTSASPLQFQSPRIPESPPGAQVMAAYFTVVNDSDVDRVISEIHSRSFGKIEIHRSSIENGVAGMQHLDALQIPAKSSVTLKPGGIHLMLFSPREDFSDGDIITLTLIEADGTEHMLVTTVQRQATDATDKH